MNLNDISRLFDYTEYANHLTLDAAEKLTGEQLLHDFKISHGSIFGTLTHMAGAEWVWLSRWQGTSPSESWNDKTFPDLSSLRARLFCVGRDFCTGPPKANAPTEPIVTGRQRNGSRSGRLVANVA